VHFLVSIDPSTMAFVAGVISALQALAFGVVWYFNRRALGIGYWTMATLLTGLAMVVLPMRSVIENPILTKALPTTMNMAASVFFYLGAAASSGKTPQLRWPLFLSAPVFLGYLWFILGDYQPRFRPLVTSPIFVLFIGSGALELLRERRRGLQFSARLIGAAAILISLVFLYRMIALPLRPQVSELMEPDGPQQALFGIMILFALFWTFGAMMLINQRQLLEIQQASEEALRAKEEASALEKEVLAERAYRQRQLLVRDLHDGLGGITAHLALLTSRPAADGTTVNRVGKLEDIQQLAQEGNRELRLLMNTLERGLIHWGDFLSECRTHADKVCAALGLPLNWTVSGRPPVEAWHDVPAMLSLLRAVKEALNNAARHGQPANISCRFAFRSRAMGIVIRDDGCGFSIAQRSGPGRGLDNIRRRIEELGGRVKIGSSLGSGTVLRFVVPMPVAILSGSDDRWKTGP
jgi:signal transduction histidine kinase